MSHHKTLFSKKKKKKKGSLFLPGPEWSETQSNPPHRASVGGWWTGWRCLPEPPVCMAADTAVCCDAFPSGHFLRTSAPQSPPPALGQEESHPHAPSPCSHRRTYSTHVEVSAQLQIQGGSLYGRFDVMTFFLLYSIHCLFAFSNIQCLAGGQQWKPWVAENKSSTFKKKLLLGDE